MRCYPTVVMAGTNRQHSSFLGVYETFPDRSHKIDLHRQHIIIFIMGGRYSALSGPNDRESDNGDSYFALAILEPDRLCLVQAGSDVIDVIQRSIRGDRSQSTLSTSGQNPDDIVQKEQRKDDGSYEIQFRGHPFSRFAGRSAAMRIKRLLCHLVANLYTNGWDLSVASDLTTDDYHTTWFFRHSALGRRAGQTNQGGSIIKSKKRIVSLSLSGSDGLILVNAPVRLHKALVDAVRFGYAYGSESEDILEGDLEIKLNGGPWETNMVEEGIWARKLLLEIFRQFARYRYVYYAVADTKGTADSIFFIYQQPESGPPTTMTEGRPQSHNVTAKAVGTSEIPGSPSAVTAQVIPERKRSSYCAGDDLRAATSNLSISHIATSTSKDSLEVACQPRRTSWQEPPTLTPERAQAPSTDQYPFQVEQFFMVSLNRTDSLRLIDAPSSVRALIKDVILSHWPYGLKRETKYDIAFEYRMNRTPWSASSGDAVAARSFLTVLFEKMLSQGWRLLATLDISRRWNDKSVFVFKSNKSDMRRRKDPSFHAGALTQHHFCLSMTDGDKIRIIRGDDQVTRVVKNVVNKHWPYGIQKEREFFGSYEIQVVGHPWLNLPGNGNEPLVARVMMLEMLRAFHANNWRVIVSADLSGRYQTPANLVYNPVSVDSWIVAKEQVERNDVSQADREVNGDEKELTKAVVVSNDVE